jgi:CubicO group peptidase (beta-lactamase class C family)
MVVPCAAQDGGEGGWIPPVEGPARLVRESPRRGPSEPGPGLRAIPWRTGYELTEAEYATFLDEAKADGLRPVSVVSRTADGGARFTVVAHGDGVTDWLTATSVSAGDVQAWLEQQIDAGYAPVAIACHGEYPTDLYSAVAARTEDPRDFTVYAGLTTSELSSAVNNASNTGRRLAWVSGCGSGANIRYAAMIVDNPTYMGWWAFWNQNEAGFENQLEARRTNGARPGSLTGFGPADSPRFAGVAHYRRTENWELPFDLSLADYEQLEGEMDGEGWYPTTIATYETAAGVRAAGVFVAEPAPRALTVTGVEVPELAAFDEAMIDHIQQCDLPNAALAVVKDGRLVMARGYTYAPADWPTVTEPDTLFRIASMSKPLCSVAMHQAAERGVLGLDDLMVDYEGLGGWTDNRAAAVTLRYLLQHRGGWNRYTAYDPLVYDATIAQSLGIPLPIGIWDIITYMKNRAFQFTPGTQQQYSNFGVLLAARALESVDGRPYEQIVRQDILGPLGVYRSRLSEWTGDRPGETRYMDGLHARPPSVMSPDQEVLDGWCYGGINHDNFDSAGAWMFSAIDYCRFLSAFDDLDQSPLLPRARIEEMWAPPIGDPGDGQWYLSSGWIVSRFGDVYRAGHDGSFPGTATWGERLENGVQYVVFQNMRDASELYEPYQVTYTLEALSASQDKWPDHDLWGMYCPGDFDGSGAADLFDFLAFVNAFNAGDDRAEFSGDGVLDLFDFLAFINAFNGC